MLFANMRIRLRYVVEDDISFKNLHTLRNILNVLSLIIIVIIGMSLHKEYLIFMILVACTKILDLQSELYYAILHKSRTLNILVCCKLENL